MRSHGIRMNPVSRAPARTATPAPPKPHRARTFESTNWRCLARVSSANCCSRGMGPAMPGNLQPEEVARLEEEPVGPADEIVEPERVRLGERRTVTEEEDRPGRRPVREQ